MGFLKNIYNVLRQPAKNQSVSLNDSRLLDWLGIDQTQTESIHEATYFTCLKMLSENHGEITSAFLPANRRRKKKERKQRNMTYLLTVRPNKIHDPEHVVHDCRR